MVFLASERDRERERIVCMFVNERCIERKIKRQREDVCVCYKHSIIKRVAQRENCERPNSSPLGP